MLINAPNEQIKPLFLPFSFKIKTGHMWPVIFFFGTVGILLFIMLFGPSTWCRNTPVHYSYIWLSISFPNMLAIIISPHFLRWCSQCVNWVGYQRNPLVQIFFATLVTCAGSMFFYSGFHRIIPLGLSSWHRLLWPLSFLSTYICFALVCHADPGIVNDHNVARKWSRFWVYDHILYTPDNYCRTCKFVKPPRSKHCSICNACVLRHDHHCVWINQCVGQSNHPYFIAFLLATTWISAYTCYLSLSIAFIALHHHGWISVSDARGFGRFQFFQYARDGSLVYKYPIEWSEGIKISILMETSLIALGLFLIFATIMVGLFASHHVWINVVNGTTTNESQKWSDILDAIKHGEIQFTSDGDTGQVYLTDSSGAPSVTSIPKHAYDGGVWANLKEIICPVAVSSVSENESSASITLKSRKKKHIFR